MESHENIKTVRNLVIDSGKRTVTINIDPRIFTLETIFKAAYNFMDKAHIIINGDPKSTIIVELTAKDDSDLEIMGDDFNNELLSYAVYELQSKRTFELRKLIIARALAGNIPPDELADLQQAGTNVSSTMKDEGCSCGCEKEESYEDDPLGIRAAWKEPAKASDPSAETADEKEESDEEIPWLSKPTKPISKSADMPAKVPGSTTFFEVKGDSVKVKINLGIYPLSSAIFAAEEFKDLCWVSLDKGDSLIEATLKPKDKDINLEELGREFLSFLISVYKDETKQEW